jgi:hypothetical protein
MVGGTGITVNHARDAVPVGDTTVTLPELVPAATVAVMLVAEFTVNDAATIPQNYLCCSGENWYQ